MIAAGVKASLPLEITPPCVACKPNIAETSVPLSPATANSIVLASPVTPLVMINPFVSEEYATVVLPTSLASAFSTTCATSLNADTLEKSKPVNAISLPFSAMVMLPSVISAKAEYREVTGAPINSEAIAVFTRLAKYKVSGFLYELS